MSARAFHRVRACYCRQRPCMCARWEARLDREGLGHLDFEDSGGNVLTSTKGSGQFGAENQPIDRESAEADIDSRRVILAEHVFAGGKGSNRGRCSAALEWKIWELYADGAQIRTIAAALGVSKSKVEQAIVRVRVDYAAAKRNPTASTMARLAAKADREVIELFCQLLIIALRSPDGGRAILEEAEGIADVKR